MLLNAKYQVLHTNNWEDLSSNCSGCSEGTPSVAEVLEVFDPVADRADVEGNGQATGLKKGGIFGCVCISTSDQD